MNAQHTNIWEQSLPKPGSQASHLSSNSALIIVGSGPVGVQLLQELKQRGFKGTITLFGDEPWRPYNRVQLSALLAGEIRFSDILYPELSLDKQHFRFLNRRVVEVQADKKALIDSDGVCHQYDVLVFATGSMPWIPNIEKIRRLKGAYVFRNLDNAEQLMARSVRTRHTIVVGGGLLGVEAARAMQRNHTQVTLVHQSNRLLNRQLDIEAGSILKRSLEGYGIEVRLNAGVCDLLGEDQVTGVVLRNGQTLSCDTVIFTTGIQPNVAVARDCGVKVGRGIKVDDTLQTSLDHVFAIGECAEHNDMVYGLLEPGLEQAAILADRLCGGNARYRGSIATASLKVLGLPIFTLGWIGDEYEKRIDSTEIFHCASGAYRKLFLQRNRLRGVVTVGECVEQNRLQRAVNTHSRILPWQLKRFQREGRLWSDAEAVHVRDWKPSIIVCSCRNITVGGLMDAQRLGCDSFEALAKGTGASTVCGACKATLDELVANPFQQLAWPARLKPLLAALVLGIALFSIALVSA